MKTPILLAALGIGFAGCVADGEKSMAPIPEGKVVFEARYILAKDRIVFPPQARTRYECGEGDRLFSVVDTTRADSMYYEIADDTLFLGLSHPETLNSGARVQGLDRFERLGPGSGIEGQWRDLDLDRLYRIRSGEPTAQEQADLERRSNLSRTEKRAGTLTYRFHHGTLTGFFDYDFAADFLADWNGRDPGNPERADSANFALSVKVVDKGTIELTGQKTGEKVRIYGPEAEIRTYSSDMAGHESYTYDQTPTACPVKPSATPVWYEPFLRDNAKP